MSDLWEQDPEAFIILRLQESSDPDSAHRAFQHVLRKIARLQEAAAEHLAACMTAGRTQDNLRQALEETSDE